MEEKQKALSIRFFAAALTAVLLYFCGEETQAATTVWPMQRGSPSGAATALCDEVPSGLQEWTFRGRLSEVYQHGIPVWASPAFAVVNGQPCVFIGGSDQTMHALNLAERRRIWFKITNGAIIDAPCVGMVGSRQVVFWGATDRTVYAHSAADGRPLWTRELVKPTNTQGEVRIPTPVWDGDALYVACFVYDKALARSEQRASLFALDAATGEVLWREDITSGALNAPVGLRRGNDLFLYVPARRGILQAFQVSRDGAFRTWSFQMPHDVMGSPAVWQDGDPPLLFLGSKFGDLIAINALTGERFWHRMTGNWVDNNACCGLVKGRAVVFVGSNDYSLYALDVGTGEVIWRRPLGAEVFSAPCLFEHQGRQLVAAACLDDRLYVVDAAAGEITACFRTGRPTWDKVPKGETLWGSPIGVTCSSEAAVVLGSYDGYVYVFPVAGESRFRVTPRRGVGVWVSVLVVAVVLAGVLPLFARPRSRL